jgi:Flp pilus assembly protein TadD
VSAGVGDKAAARAEIRRSLALDRSINTLLNGAGTLVIAGDAAAARKMLDDARRSRPAGASPEVERTFQRIDATIRLESGDRTAIDAIPPPQAENDISGRFTIGRVNLLAGNAEIAGARFKEVMDNRRPTISVNSAMAPLFYGRALVRLGRTDEARKAYDQFFGNWESADANLPIVKAAKKEYGRLQKS